MKRFYVFKSNAGKKLPAFFLFCTILILNGSFFASYAQAPEKISYQAILRDNDGKLITGAPVGMRFSILQGSAEGTVVYEETQTPTTNGNGLITVDIGAGTVVSGDFSTIDWTAGPFFLKTEADPAGGTTYSITGTSQILSVPYALFAKKSGDAFSGDYNDLTNVPVNVSSFNNDAGYLTAETDGDTTNELQTLSLAGDTLLISKTNSIVLPPDEDFHKSGHFVTTLDSVGIGTDMPRSLLEVAGPIWQSNTGGSILLGEKAGGNMDLSYEKHNVYIGSSAGRYSKGAYDNIAIGYISLQYNREGSANVAIGKNTLTNNTGSANTAVGNYSMVRNTSGTLNTALGVSTLFSNTTGNNNTALGYYTLQTNTTGHDNTATGYLALVGNTTGSYNVAVGGEALKSAGKAFSNTAVGYQSMTATTTGMRNTATGYRSLYQNKTGMDNTATGYRALASNSSGSYNTADGYYALNNNTEGNNNTAGGYHALSYNTTGKNNTAYGNRSLWKNEIGDNNTAVGDSAMTNNLNGFWNTAVGKAALASNTSSSHNTAVGHAALYHCNNTYLFNGRNTAVGDGALYSSALAYLSTVIGFKALFNIYNPAFVTAIGANIRSTESELVNSTAIGAYTTLTASNQIRLGESSIQSIGGYQNWTNISDGRFKTEVKDAVPGLDFIMKLRPVMYRLDIDKLNSFLHNPASSEQQERVMKHERPVETGFIAQEVEKAAKKIGYDFNGVDAPKNDRDYYGLRYAEFVVPLVKAVQEQQAEIEALKKQNQLLQQQIEALQNK